MDTCRTPWSSSASRSSRARRSAPSLLMFAAIRIVAGVDRLTLTVALDHFRLGGLRNGLVLDVAPHVGLIVESGQRLFAHVVLPAEQASPPAHRGRCPKNRWRRLFTMSAVLSAAVPRNRCAGLQHGGLSQ